MALPLPHLCQDLVDWHVWLECQSKLVVELKDVVERFYSLDQCVYDTFYCYKDKGKTYWERDYYYNIPADDDKLSCFQVDCGLAPHNYQMYTSHVEKRYAGDGTGIGMRNMQHKCRTDNECYSLEEPIRDVFHRVKTAVYYTPTVLKRFELYWFRMDDSVYVYQDFFTLAKKTPEILWEIVGSQVHVIEDTVN